MIGLSFKRMKGRKEKQKKGREGSKKERKKKGGRNVKERRKNRCR